MNEQAEKRWSDWLTLMNHFDHEVAEQEITDTTYGVMVKCLMTFKPRVEIEFEGYGRPSLSNYPETSMSGSTDSSRRTLKTE